METSSSYQQPFKLDLTIHPDLIKAARSDELADTLNYAQIWELAAQLIQQAQPKLIEHAAQLVLNGLFTQFPSIETFTIHIGKPAIIAQAQAVGIRLERQRNDFRARTGE